MTPWHPPAPQERLYVVGDIHGCVEPLAHLLEAIDDDIATLGGAPARVVFVGDYIDRGESSADVMRFLAHSTQAFPAAMVGLMGNHERMMLDFLADPTGKGRRWLRFGGLQTLASFGVEGTLTTDAKATSLLLDAAGDLRDAMGPELLNWLEGLALHWSSGNTWVVHAGADPDVAMTDQADKVLLWGAETFLKQERTDHQWVAFGHQPFDAPFAEAGRIATDTGAVYGGKLTAARIDPDGAIAFMSAPTP